MCRTAGPPGRRPPPQGWRSAPPRHARRSVCAATGGGRGYGQFGATWGLLRIVVEGVSAAPQIFAVGRPAQFVEKWPREPSRGRFVNGTYASPTDNVVIARLDRAIQ